MTNSTTPRTSSPLLATLLLTLPALFATGCGTTPGAPAAATPVALHNIRGKVLGGRQAVAYASLQIYQAGTSGYGSGATGLLASNVTTDATGQFNVPLAGVCTPGTQLYMAAVGGSPTQGSGTNIVNNRSVLLAGLGECSAVAAGLQVNINEVTTVATVWALSQFMALPSTSTPVVNESGAVDAAGINVGAPASNSAGLAAAFGDINSLANISSGYPTTGTPGVTVPTQEMYLLANILAGCVDGNGSQSGCTMLFSDAQPAGGVLPGDVFAAALDIARNPGNNVTAILDLSLPAGPYSSTIASINDWTLGVTYTGNGLSSPTGVAVDASQNVWVANSASNAVVQLAHNGSANSGASGFTGNGLNAPSAIALDVQGNAWITNAGSSTVTEFDPYGDSISGSPFSGGGLATPTAISFDATGNAWIANSGNSSVSELSSSGVALSPASTGYASNGASAPVGVVVNPR